MKEANKMAKGQKRSNREIKKPKAAKKPVADAGSTRGQVSIKSGMLKGSSKPSAHNA